MQINVSIQQGRVPITILQLNGDLDASNYTEPIQQAQALFDGGTRYVIIDLSSVPYLSSAGLMAMHTMALIFSGSETAHSQSGRPSFRAMDPKRDQVVREHVKLLNPQPKVDQVLDMVGLKQFLEIYTDLDSAVKSF